MFGFGLICRDSEKEPFREQSIEALSEQSSAGWTNDVSANEDRSRAAAAAGAAAAAVGVASAVMGSGKIRAEADVDSDVDSVETR